MTLHMKQICLGTVNIHTPEDLGACLWLYFCRSTSGATNSGDPVQDQNRKSMYALQLAPVDMTCNGVAHYLHGP